MIRISSVVFSVQHSRLQKWFLVLPVSIFATFACSTGIPVKIPKYPTGNVGEQLKEVMGYKRNIGIVSFHKTSFVDPIRGQLGSTIKALLEDELSRKGYYRITDISSRLDRLREIEFSQSGLTEEQKTIGKELAIDGFFYVFPSGSPGSECTSETSYLTETRQYKDSTGKLITKSYQKPVQTMVRYYTLPVTARLVNVENGRSVSASYRQAYRLSGVAGSRMCPSLLDAQSRAIAEAAEKLADALSPTMEEYKIPLSHDVDEVAEAHKKQTEELLEAGIDLVKKENYESAAQQWEMALQKSAGRSRAALWNLGARFWFSGNLDKAEEFFKNALRPAGDKDDVSYMDRSDMNKAWLLFQQEKERIKQEKE